MKILIVGAGAREHAITKSFSKSASSPVLFCAAPSINPAIQKLCKEYAVIDVDNVDAISTFAKQYKIDMVFIGPEAPLAAGLVDKLLLHGVPVIGPSQKLAQIETSKSFARYIMQEYHIPGLPIYQSFTNLNGVEKFLKYLGEDNFVIKADGLMGGKGVKVAGEHLHSIEEALHFCEWLARNDKNFIIEEKFIGEEFSLMCFTDGNAVVFMPPVQDHKRAFNGDQGPNTGGMGSYSDANFNLPFLHENDIHQAQHINQKILEALQNKFHEPYRGILYGSFIATKNGVQVIEFNARFGDPEALNILSLLQSDFVELCQAIIQGNLNKNRIIFSHLATVCKYAVPEGYPDNPCQDFVVDVSHVKDTDHLYFGAVKVKDGKCLATGSRTIAFVGIDKTISDAEKICEAAIKTIKGPLFHREDIGTNSLIQKRIQHMQSLRP